MTGEEQEKHSGPVFVSGIRGLIAFVALGIVLFANVANAARLDEQFLNPPEATKPWCYWYWLDGDISEDGITKDLESMARVGISRAMIGNIKGGGAVKMFSPEWYAATRHAFQEASRVGVTLYMFNGPGWSQSGGPWITPEQSMRRVDWNEFPVSGGELSLKVRTDGIDRSQDIAVLAVPRIEAVSIVGKKRTNALHFAHTEPFTARALVVHGTANAKLYALQNRERKFIADIDAAGGSVKTDFLPDGIETFSFNDITAQRFELVPGATGKVVLTSEPRVAQVIEKQMGRMHPTPRPTWESYTFPDTVEPGSPSVVLKRENIINLSDKLNGDGVLACSLPEGDWTIIYFGMVSTGKKNHPAPPEATGLECDKMSKVHTEHHFNAMFGKLLKEMTPDERSAFKGITIDSYEVGAQNWTDGFADEFERRNGYNPLALLPVMTGRVVDSAKTSDQFLWDLRRTVADMIAENYIGGLREIAHKHELTLWCENYGHWGFPGEFLNYGGQSDEIGGEFWIAEKLGPLECRAASSAGHIYGKRRIFSEAFTSSLDPGHHPYAFKARGEELFCEGVNHFVLHVYAHQPRDGMPGKNPWFGAAFHRNTPWFNESRDWIKYLQRCHYLLQQGEPVADVAVYIGDFAPQMTGPTNPVPTGYDYDYMGSDAILHRLYVVDDEWVIYDEHDPKRIAARYKLLAMPKVKYIRPHVLERLEELYSAGGKIIESVPVSAATLGDNGIEPIVGDTTSPVRWKARKLDDGMIFFFSNFQKKGAFEATLRVTGKVPELYNPVTGQIKKLARYKMEQGRTRISINVKDLSDSCFIVFRDSPLQPSVVSVTSEGKEVLPGDIDLFYNENSQLIAESATPGCYTLSMSDGGSKTLQITQASQTLAIEGPWRTNQMDNEGFSSLHETTFNLPRNFGSGQRVILDLGEVEVMARVTLNGKVFDTLWMPPFELDVSDAMKPGKNKLRILVTSTSQGKPKLGATVRLYTAPRSIVE